MPTPDDFRVEMVPGPDHEAWGEILARDPDATFFHDPAWSAALADVYPYYRPHGLLARDRAGRLAGGLPVIRSMRFGLIQLLSLPYGTYAAPLARSESGEERCAIRTALLSAWIREARRPGVVRAHLVLFSPAGRLPESSLVPRSRQTAERTHLVEMGAGFEQVWSEVFAGDVRTACRKAERAGITAGEESTAEGASALDDMYRSQAAGWTNHTPYPPGLFHRLLERLPGRVRVWVARSEEEPVAAQMVLYHRDTALTWIEAKRPRARRTGAGTFLYRTVMEDACARGFTRHNLGGSGGRGTLEAYKRDFGSVPVDYVTALYESEWFRPLHRLHYRLRGIHEEAR